MRVVIAEMKAFGITLIVLGALLAVASGLSFAVAGLGHTNHPHGVEIAGGIAIALAILAALSGNLALFKDRERKQMR